MVGDELLHVARVFDGQVVAHARGDEHLLDAGDGARLAVEFDEGGVVGDEVLADLRIDAGGLAAGCLDVARLAGDAVHVGGGAAEVGDDAGEAGEAVAEGGDLAEDGGLGAVLDDAPLVLGDGAEAAAAETAALDGHREADHLVGGDFRVAVARVGDAGEGAVVDEVHLRGGERDGRRVDPELAVAVALDERLGVVRVGLAVEHAGGVGVENCVVCDGLKGRQPDGATVSGRDDG